MYFGCDCRSVPLSSEGAFMVTVDRYGAAWSGHLKLEIGVVWDRIEMSKSGSPEQGVVANAEWDNIEDQVFPSEIFR